MTNETREKWKNHKEKMENMRRRRRSQFYEVIKTFRRLGFEVEEVSKYQFRFNGGIDIFPSNRGYRDLVNHKSGRIEKEKTFEAFLREHFGLIAH